MAELAIGMHYLTRYAVATDPSDRERVEWPPHPARVFMALAAAHFETDEDEAEAAALRWLESLGAPELVLPTVTAAQQRQVVTSYVPVNDRAGPSAAALQSAPAVTRSKQPRTFPKMWVGDEPCLLVWSEVDDDELNRHRAALAKVCDKVTRVGHSSSLVRLWLADADEAASADAARHVPEPVTGTVRLRQASAGCLDHLVRQFNREAVDAFAMLDETIRSAKGKAQREAKARFEQRFGQKWKSSLTPPMPMRPTISLAEGYAPLAPKPDAEAATTCFDSNLLVLSKVEGSHLGLEATLQLTTALRGTIMARCAEQPPPEWISGHTADGQPTGADHLAIMPLPFVGSEHADGHVLGLALAFPRDVSVEERGKALRGLVDENDGTLKVELTLGRLGTWKLERERRARPARALRPEMWTGLEQDGRAKHTTWASVTPVVLDRFPKTDRHKDPQGWAAAASRIVAASCQRIGLPEPVTIDVDTTSWHRGAPRAVVKRRPLRNGRADAHEAALGPGFPMMPVKPTRPPRPQVHVHLEFDLPVAGPVLLGAGRYLGYGLCKPMSRRGDET